LRVIARELEHAQLRRGVLDLSERRVEIRSDLDHVPARSKELDEVSRKRDVARCDEDLCHPLSTPHLRACTTCARESSDTTRDERRMRRMRRMR
jgi:hypothetical protein